MSERVVLVTGGSREVGLAVARRMLDDGCAVCVTARKPEGLQAAEQQLGGSKRVMTVAGRSDDAEYRRETVEAIIARFGRLDVLVNNAALHPEPGLGMYGASKAALAHMTHQLALELAPDIRVNAVFPALIATDFSNCLYAGRREEVERRYPRARLGAPADVAAAVAFLASEHAGWITGQSIVLDGGLSLTGGVA